MQRVIMSTLVQTFQRNVHGRDFVVGDIHGHFTRLEAALARVDFDRSVDRLFSVGDLVDRGPESSRVLDYLKRPWLVAVRGNHEDMAIRHPNGHRDTEAYRDNGGGWLIESPMEFQLEVAAALSALPIAVSIDTLAGKIGIVHADCPTQSWEEFTSRLEDPLLSNSELKHLLRGALWSRERIEWDDQRPVEDVTAVIVGHTPVPSSRCIANVYYTDTGVCYPNLNKLTLFQLSPDAETVIREAATA